MKSAIRSAIVPVLAVAFVASIAFVKIASADADYSEPIDYGGGADYSEPIDYGGGADYSEPIDYGYNYSEPIDYGYDYSEPIDYGYDYSEPIDYGYDYSEPIDYGYDYSEPIDYGYDYSEPIDYASCDYGCGQDYGYSPSYSQSYSQPRYSTPSYSAPRVVNPSYASYASASYPVSQPRTSQPVVQPIYQQQQQQQQQTSRPQVTPININNVNTNTNTNVNTNTNAAPAPVYASAPIYPVYQHPTYYPVQYTFPQTYPVQALSCVITVNPNSIQNGARALLTWSSYGASSAWISDGIGSVVPNGSLSVSPNGSRSYTLTVTDWMGRTQSCTTFLAVSGVAPYVSLSQIPYTGFDFGTFGNAIYWGGLLAFALSLAYLALYYVPGHLGLGSAMVALGTTRRTQGLVRSPLSLSDVTTPDLFGSASQKPAKARTQGAAPATTENTANPPARKLAREDRPVVAANAPKDAMNFVPAKEGEMPRIVIDRS